MKSSWRRCRMVRADFLKSQFRKAIMMHKLHMKRANTILEQNPLLSCLSVQVRVSSKSSLPHHIHGHSRATYKLVQTDKSDGILKPSSRRFLPRCPTPLTHSHKSYLRDLQMGKKGHVIMLDSVVFAFTDNFLRWIE
ncbi:hypothetical protein CBL_07265 [Carabus blaptoides fortunei]